MPKNLALKSIPVNSVVLEAVCNRCEKMSSRRGGHVVDLDTRQHFICAGCLNDIEREAYRDFLLALDLLGGAA